MKQPASLLATLGLLLITGCAQASSEPSAPEPAGSLKEGVERRVDGAVAAGFSGAILVSHGGERLVVGGYGLANRDLQVPNREDTAFDVGSIMKTLTAIALFRLEQQGVLALSDTLGTLLPDIPADKAPITLLQIVQHRAGFDEYHDTMGDFEAMTRLEARERILQQELLFEPGSDVAYSNSGYTLLADVIESLSGEAFSVVVREQVFAPSGMDHSGFYGEALWQGIDTAIGYDAAMFGDNDPATWPYTWSLMGNGGLMTTVVDLERLSEALWGGALLDLPALDALKQAYFAPEAATLGGKVVYGGAGAGDFGLGGVLIDAPETSTRVIIASNSYDELDVEAFAVELATLVLQWQE
jgi:CubicO group peptidase (beta-lactamase class C family)